MRSFQLLAKAMYEILSALSSDSPYSQALAATAASHYSAYLSFSAATMTETQDSLVGNSIKLYCFQIPKGLSNEPRERGREG